MRHGRAGYRLGRTTAHRASTLRNLAVALFEHGQIVTTIPKAKAIKPLVDKIVTLGKRDTLHARRQAASFLMTTDSVKKLFDKIGPRFSQRNGGYTRIVRLGWRKGDGAEICMLELVGSELVKRADERRKRKEERLKEMREQGGEAPPE